MGKYKLYYNWGQRALKSISDRGNYIIVVLSAPESHLNDVLEAVNGVVSEARIKWVQRNIVTRESEVNIDRYLQENI